MTAPARTRQRAPVVLLRPVPGDTVIHRLWAGTKLIVVAGIGVLLTFYPGWVPIGLVAGLVLTTAWLAHIPRGALPSIPRWLWIVVIIAYFVGVASLAHVIAGSSETLYVVFKGEHTFGEYLVGFLLPAFLGNSVGGVALVGALAHAQHAPAE